MDLSAIPITGRVAVVGIGDTDYARDYRRSPTEGAPPDRYDHAVTAFKRAIADGGMRRDDIDGLFVDAALSCERIGEILGINPRWSSEGNIAAGLLQATLAISTGMANVVVLVYGSDQRSSGVQYGGASTGTTPRFLSYIYYTPWGLTSQGALYALMTQRYMHLYGLQAEDLAEVAIAQRRFAQMNENAIMRAPISVSDYLATRFICEPLRLLDYCLVNDGGVCLILSRVDIAHRYNSIPIVIEGIASSDVNEAATSLWPRLVDFYHSAHERAAAEVYEMSGTGPDQIDVLQIYDSFSSHVIFALEGFGFCGRGKAAKFIREQGIGPGGRLPTNTSGGHLSESYMQGWNHQVELVRQLRHDAGSRQIPGAGTGQYISDIAGKVFSLVYRRNAP